MTVLLRRRGVCRPGGALVSDDFSDADSTNISGKATDTGQTWVVASGTWTVTGGKAVPSGAGSELHATVDAGVANVASQITASRPAGNFPYVGVTARFGDVSNYWTVEAHNTGGTYKLTKRVAGAYTTIASGPAWAAGVAAVLRLEVNGNSINAKINGTSFATTTDAALATNTKHGMKIFDNGAAGSTFDDFTVEAL